MQLSPVINFNGRSTIPKSKNRYGNKAQNTKLKTAAMLTGAATLGALGTCAIFYAKKNNSIKTLKNLFDDFISRNTEADTVAKQVKRQTNLIQEEIKTISKKAKDEYARLTKLLSSGDDISQIGANPRKIVQLSDTKTVLIELFENENLTRKTTFVNGLPQRIEEKSIAPDKKGTKKVYTFLEGKLCEYVENLKRINNDCYTCEKRIEFGSGFFENNGLPRKYTQGYKLISEMQQESAKQLIFANGVPNEYLEGVKDIDDHTTVIAKKVLLKKGKPSDIILELNVTNKSAKKAFARTKKGWSDTTLEVAKRYFPPRKSAKS